jgi:DNA repair protein RadC
MLVSPKTATLQTLTQIALYSTDVDEDQRLEFAHELIKRRARQVLLSQSLTSPADAVNYIRTLISLEEHEQFIALYVNAQNFVIWDEVISSGTTTQCQISVGPIVKSALLKNATGVIVAHNHPGGTLVASKQDIHATKQIAKALELVGISLLDSIIVTQDETNFVSMQQDGVF